MYVLFLRSQGKLNKKAAICLPTAVFSKTFSWELSVQQSVFFFGLFIKIRYEVHAEAYCPGAVPLDPPSAIIHLFIKKTKLKPQNQTQKI